MTQRADADLPLTGVFNFPDAGGYAARDGATMRRGVLWRSAHHETASDLDLDRIDALALATVVDLRGDGERRAHRCRRGPGFAATVRFASGETAGLAPHLARAGEAIDADTARRLMIDTYRHMPDRAVLAAAMTMMLDALASGHTPLLVHCVAGKDRTGLAVALVHRLLGVHPDDIMADYLRTATVARQDARVAQGAAALRRARADIDDAAIGVLMGVEPAFLNAAFDRIDADFGGVEAFARERLDLSPERRMALERALLD